MSRKMECPGCGAYTSSVAAAVDMGNACPYCDLSADAIDKVLEARRRHGETKLVEDLTAALKRADKAEAEAFRFRSAMAEIRSVVSRAASPSRWADGHGGTSDCCTFGCPEASS